MSDGQEVLVVTRARFAEIDMDRMAAIRSRAHAVLGANPGLLSLTLWERHDDPFAFVILAHFRTDADSLGAWDTMMASPVMEVVTELMSEAPNTQRFFMVSRSGILLEKTSVGTFCSLSTRIADMGYGSNMVQELEGIFEELRMIPGFLGSFIGQMTDMPDEVLGLALWATRQAYDASIPEHQTYRIDLYQRVL